MVGSRSVDVVRQWSERIAEEVAPDESDFAAEVGEAYAKGGSDRRNLLSRPGAQPGAFDPENFATSLPLILQALAEAGKTLLWLLRSPDLNNALATGSLVVALRASHGHNQASKPEQPHTLPAAKPEAPSAVPVHENAQQAVEWAFVSVRDRLLAAGFDQESADQITYPLLVMMLKDPAGAAQFLDTLTAASNGAAPPGSAPKAKRKRPRRAS